MLGRARSAALRAHGRHFWAEAAALGGAVVAARYGLSVRTPRVYHRGGERMRGLLAQVPGLHRPVWPSPLLHSSVPLAMALGMKLRERGKARLEFDQQEIEHADGGVSALRWARGAPPADVDLPPLGADAPLLLLLHTITACSAEVFGLAPLLIAARKRGWRAAIHVRRGCGGLHVAAGGRWNPFGCADDLRDAVDAARAAHPAAACVGAVGISAGSAVLGRYLGEHAEHARASGLRGAVLIGAGYRMPHAYERVAWPYGRIVLRKLRAHFLSAARQPHMGAGREHLLEAAVRAASLPALFDALAPLCGYGSPAQYRQRCDPHAVRSRVRTPLLCLNSLDDPLAVAANIDYDWFEADAHDCVALATVPHGAHIEFLEWKGGGLLRPWADEVALDFLAAATDRKAAGAAQ